MLLVAIELCSLAFRLDKLTKANIVATALFGDGAAACVLQSGEAGIAAVEMSGQHSWPDTLEIMGWSIDPQGFGVIFDRDIPPFAEANMAPAVAGILDRAGLGLGDIDRFAFHPGGTKVVNALEQALSLGQGSLTTNARCWPNMATCRRRRRYSCWSASSGTDWRRARC